MFFVDEIGKAVLHGERAVLAPVHSAGSASSSADVPGVAEEQPTAVSVQKTKVPPLLPTPEERTRHGFTHIPFAPWCETRVKAR